MSNYNQHMDILFKHLEKIDVPRLIDNCDEPWYNQTLTEVNGSVVRLGIIQGEYHWHNHPNDDEFFFVLGGRLIIELEGSTIELGPLEGATITKGVMHKPIAPEKTVILMVETSSIDPIGESK